MIRRSSYDRSTPLPSIQTQRTVGVCPIDAYSDRKADPRPKNPYQSPRATPGLTCIPGHHASQPGIPAPEESFRTSPP